MGAAPKVEEKSVEERWVCAGERFYLLSESPKKKLVTVWFRLEDGKIVGDELIFEKVKAWPGAVHSVRVVKDDSRTRFKGSEFVEEFSDRSKILEWKALQDAARTENEAARAESRGKNRDPYEVLEPLRRAYQRSTPIGRQVIVAKAIRFIMYGARE